MRCRQALLALLLLAMPATAGAETCRFAGETTHDGHLAVDVTTAQSGDTLTVDVTVNFTISTVFAEVDYRGQEISTWRGDRLQLVGVNQRTIIDHAIKRQQWDVFRRNGDRLDAYRVQAKRLVDFHQHHPGFETHWDPSRFGAPWLADYPAATPDRRPDLDLPADATTRPPLAMAFYWSRFLPEAGGAATLVLPGFKRDKTAAIRFDPAIPGSGWRRWSAPLVHPGLEHRPLSLAAAWVSPQNYLLQLGFDMHTSWAAGQAILRAQGCRGVLLRPG